MLLLYILWDDWPIFMISGSNEQLQQQLEYTPLKHDCHSWWISELEPHYQMQFDVILRTPLLFSRGSFTSLQGIQSAYSNIWRQGYMKIDLTNNICLNRFSVDAFHQFFWQVCEHAYKRSQVKNYNETC